jgi:hypothetical protein
MGAKFKRTKFLVNHSIQLKYIAFSILPALVISLFCSVLLIKSGELILKTEREDRFADISEITQTIYNIDTEGCPDNTTEEIRRLMARLLPLQNTLAMTHFDTLAKWNKVKFIIVFSLLMILLCIGILALLASHRIAGPLFRIKQSLDSLCEGKDIPPVRLRKHDELKDMAESLDKLRRHLKNKGLLEPDE